MKKRAFEFFLAGVAVMVLVGGMMLSYHILRWLVLRWCGC